MLVNITNDKFTLNHQSSDILTNAQLKVNGDALKISDFKNAENETQITYKMESEEFFALTLTIKYKDNTALFYLNGGFEQKFLTDGVAFNKNNGIEIVFDGLGKASGLLSLYLHKTWWTRPDFTEDATKIPDKTQALAVKGENSHSFFLPVCENEYKSEFCSNTLKIFAGSDGYSKINSCILSVATADSPFKASKLAFENAIDSGVLGIKKREEKSLPEQFKYLGWCTWDAFYHEVSDAKMTEKLCEFKEKDIPVRWLIVDDGWAQTTGVKKECDWKLTSFKEDAEKFPEGLKGFIKKAKEEFGFMSIGVWHSFMGYWLGIEADSEVYKEQKDNLRKTRSGLYFPDWENEKSYNFFNTWHSYLKAQGVDFLKIDTQASLGAYLDGNCSKSSATKNMHNSLEKSVKENFDSNIINCMGLAQENALSRECTPVTRSSDDFFPNGENGFGEHAIQNAYNCLYHGNLYFCDWDMWWTMHDSAVNSGVLRGISGGPVYVSDEAGKTDKNLLLPLYEEDGRLLMCDYAALPAMDCIYTDCTKSKTPLKIFNKAGEVGVVAAFNIDAENASVKGTVSLSDIDGLEDGEYIAYGYFSKKFYKVDKDTKIEIELSKEACEIFNFYPVKNGKVLLGDLTKYISGASSEKTEVLADTLIK